MLKLALFKWKIIINQLKVIMNYKERIDALRSLFLSTDKPVEEIEAKVEEVELMEEGSEDKAPVEEAVPAEYVTLAQFNELREDTKKFMESVTEMLSSAMEMINSTEKNTVPVEASKEEEEVELAAEPVTHDPEAVVTNATLKVKIGAGSPKTASQRASESWYNTVNKLNN